MKPREPGRQSSAAYDLGLTEEARQDYRLRLALIFEEGRAIFGEKAAATLFRNQVALIPKRPRKNRPPPPHKQKGPHDPEGDQLLLELWRAVGDGMGKRTFARMALQNHAVKIDGRVRPQEKAPVDSLVRRLNRILRREAE